MRSALLLLLVSVGCQTGTPVPKINAQDIGAICNSVERSGAAALEPADQAYTIAQWLPANVSAEGRKWLVSWARLGDDRAARHRMLENDARIAGVVDCPLLEQW